MQGVSTHPYGILYAQAGLPQAPQHGCGQAQHNTAQRSTHVS